MDFSKPQGLIRARRQRLRSRSTRADAAAQAIWAPKTFPAFKNGPCASRTPAVRRRSEPLARPQPASHLGPPVRASARRHLRQAPCGPCLRGGFVSGNGGGSALVCPRRQRRHLMRIFLPPRRTLSSEIVPHPRAGPPPHCWPTLSQDSCGPWCTRSCVSRWNTRADTPARCPGGWPPVSA